jgi:hypothetical protein
VVLSGKASMLRAWDGSDITRIVLDPSWNTDQGVLELCECFGSSKPTTRSESKFSCVIQPFTCSCRGSVATHPNLDLWVLLSGEAHREGIAGLA